MGISLKVDSNSPIPIYVQIREIIRKEIINGEYVGKMYAITSLAERFRVNRHTVRRAIDELIREGLMYSVKGVGTFPSPPGTIVESIDQPLNFFQNESLQGRNARVEVRKFKWIPSPAQVAASLKILSGTPVLFIDRLRLVDDVPLAIEHRYIRSPWANVLTYQAISDSKHLIRQTLSNQTGVKWQGLENEIGAMLANSQQAKDLKVEQESTLLMRRFLMYGENDQAIICGSSYYRADRYRWKTYVNLAK